MQTYILKVVPSEFPNCVRVFEIGAEQSLLSLHEAIASEFKVTGEQPHAFFLSGDFLDAASAFAGTPAGGGVTGIVRLSSLDLTKGMRFGYAFDYQAEDGLYVEVIDLAAGKAGESYPRVVSREGELPEPEALMAGGHPCGCGCGEESEDADGDCGCGDAGASGEGCDHECDHECADCGCGDDDVEIHPDDCACEECEAVRKARAEFDAEPLARLGKAIEASITEEKPDAEPLLAGLEALVALCPTADRLERLGMALNLPIGDWAGSLISFLRKEIAAERLLAVSEGFLKLTGASFEKVTHATILAGVGRTAEALELIETAEATNPFERDVLAVERARIQRKAGRAKEAEAALRGLLARRWLSFELREQCIEELEAILSDGGREDELEALIDAEEALLDKNEALRRGVVKNGPKVEANDKCPCGSGLKYKKCCGQAA